MHRLVPEFILEQYQRQRQSGELAAIGMFLDISGFSAMTDSLMQHGQHGGEILASMMRSVFDPLLRKVYEQEGFVVGIAGDSITALFPLADQPAEAALRALAAAWKIQKHLSENPEHQTEYGVFKISAKIGLTLGEAKWGLLTSRTNQKATYYFRGSAVDVSALAEKQAQAGEIILSQEFFDQATDLVSVEQRGSFFHLLGMSVNLPEATEILLKSFPAEILQNFAPKELLLQEVSSEFRQSVVLFFTFPDLSDHELQEFMFNLFDLQEIYGGLIDHVDFGDKGCNLVILWGAPVAYENDIDRAINFITALQSRAGFLLKTGLTYYISRSGFIGSDLFEVYTCYGWGINLAARMMMSASEGQIRLDERIARRLEARFELEFIGEQVFKGFAQKQKVYLLGARKPEAKVIFSGQMLGREVELEQLAQFAQPLWNGKFAGTAIVWGEAGIGKSRLVYEFQGSSTFREHPALWAICQSEQLLRQPFNPFRYWLKAYFGCSGIDENSDRVLFEGKFQSLVERTSQFELVNELKRLKSILGSLVDLFWPDSLYDQLDAQGRYENIHLALMALIKAESLIQPVLLSIEDAHYLEDDSKAFLRYLRRAFLAESVTYPVAILATARREGAALPLDLDFADLEIDLGGLSRQALAGLSSAILGRPASPQLLQMLFERSEGNPFFADQILRYLQEEGLLSETGEVRPNRVDSRKSAIPTDINAILIARLDQLSKNVRLIVQTASVLGREFEIQILAKMLKDGNGLSDEVADAEKSAIWSALSEIRYIFRHALLRDTAYSMQMQARRQELHALALEALESLYVNELRSHFGELAYHSEQAGLLETAHHYLSLAGDVAREVYQNSKALEYYGRALKTLPDQALAERYDLSLKREALFALAGQKDEQASELELLSGLAQALHEPEKTATVSYRQAEYQVTAGNYQKAVELAHQALEFLGRSGELAVEGLLQRVISASFYRQGKYAEAIVEIERGIGILRQTQHREEEADLLNLLGMVLIESNQREAAKSHFEQSLEIFTQIANLRGQAKVLNNLGLLESMQGNFEASQMDYEKALVIARETGQRKGEGLLLGNLGFIAGLKGDFAHALEYGLRNLQVTRETGDRYTETIGLINLSGHAGALGDFASAINYARQALELARQSGDLNAEAWALTYLGHGLLDRGELEPAREVYQAALTIRTTLSQPALAPEPEAGLARIALLKNELVLAQTLVGSILTYLAEGGTLDGTDQPLRVYHVCYLVLNALQDLRARQVLETACGLLNARAARISDLAARKLFLENISYHHELLTAWQSQ